MHNIKNEDIVGKFIEPEFGGFFLIIGLKNKFIIFGNGHFLPITKFTEDYIFQESTNVFKYNKN